LRNEVGLRTDLTNNIWGVENGVDELFRTDLGGDIHTDNPGEEVNFFGGGDQPGKFFGYPYCFSEFSLPASVGGGNPGNQWVHSKFQGVSPYSDEWCRDTKNVVRPKYVAQAHMAPLDIMFWSGSSFPDIYHGNAFVAFHGSWNRSPAVGYRVDFLETDGAEVTRSTTFLRYNSTAATGRGWIRPANLAQIKCSSGDCLLISSDATNSIISVSYNATSWRD